MRRIILVSLIAALLVGIVAGASGFFAYQLFGAPGPHTSEQTVIIRRGAGLGAVANRLEAGGVISSGQLFSAIARFEGAASLIRAGEYAIPGRASMADVLDILVRGETVLRRLTIPEGFATGQILSLVQSADGVIPTQFLRLPDEGIYLPETYFYSFGDTVADILARMRKAQEDLLVGLWDRRPDGFALLSIDEVVILASIIERETAIVPERPMVAAVFLNRLQRGMRLQSDPTVIYGISQGAPLGRALGASDLQSLTPYNTYLIGGLPPGPISNPGRAAIEAVFRPARSTALYFVADGTGGHVFAETLEEHNRNVARWRRIERQKRQ